MFTKAYLEGLPATGKPYRKWEGDHSGFGIQVSANGAKAFFLLYRWQGKRVFLSLGRLQPGRTVKDIGLADARKKANEARALLAKGINPRDHWRELAETIERERAVAEQRRREEEAKGSVEQLFDAYVLSLEKAGKISASEVRRSLEADALSVLGKHTKAKDVRPQDIRLVLHRIIKRGAPIQANRLRSYLSAAFSYGIAHDNDPRQVEADVLFFLQYNPVRDVPKAVKHEAPGERDLSPKEIRAFWQALTARRASPIHALALKLTLATAGQRITQVLRAEWEHIDIDRGIWDVPARMTKSGKPHVVPLASLSVEILKELQVFTGGGPLLFPKQRAANEATPEAAPEATPDTSLSQTVRRLHKIETKHAVSEGREPKFAAFVPRDLRRTAKTRMGEIGLSKEIRDRLQGHALNDVSSRHYDRYDYLDEKRQAMEAWDRYLRRIIAGQHRTPTTTAAAPNTRYKADAPVRWRR